MRLTEKQIQGMAPQIGAQAVPDSHPATPQLTQAFGDHTFFVNDDGLEILETAEVDGGAPGVHVVRLASWADAEHTRLAPHPPQVMDVVVELEPE